jgi:hypothetical protein
MDVIDSIKERQEALRRATRDVLTRVAECIEVVCVIFGNALYCSKSQGFCTLPTVCNSLQFLLFPCILPLTKPGIRRL